MDWPILGKKRLLAQAAALPPEPPAKKQRSSRHCVGKLDLVLSRAELPEEAETLIESFVLSATAAARYKAFFEKYGKQNAKFLGPGFVSSWHPRVASKTRRRWLWNSFAKEPSTGSRAYWVSDMESPMPDLGVLKALVGKPVLITYLNREGLRMEYVKLIVHASSRAVGVREIGGDLGDARCFTLRCDRLQRLDLFVDLPIPGAVEPGVPECLRDH